MIKPRNISLGGILLWAELGISGLYSITLLSYIKLNATELDIAPGFFLQTGVASAISLIIGALMVYFLIRGYGWLRWLFLISASLHGLLLFLPNLSSSLDLLPFAKPVQTLQVLLTILALWFVFQADSRKWFKCQSDSRSG